MTGRERATLEACYREHFDRVGRALRPILEQADRETVIHELFSRLIADADVPGFEYTIRDLVW